MIEGVEGGSNPFIISKETSDRISKCFDGMHLENLLGRNEVPLLVLQSWFIIATGWLREKKVR